METSRASDQEYPQTPSPWETTLPTTQPCLCNKVGYQRTGPAALTSLLGFPPGVRAAPDPQQLPGGVCSVETERSLPPHHCQALGLCCIVPTLGSVLALFSQTTSQSPALEDQRRFQPPLKRLYFPYIFEEFFTFLIAGTADTESVTAMGRRRLMYVHRERCAQTLITPGAQPRLSHGHRQRQKHRTALNPQPGSPRRGTHQGQAKFSQGNEEASTDPSRAERTPVLNSPSHLKPLERETASFFLSLLQTSPLTSAAPGPTGWVALARLPAAPSTGAAAVPPEHPIYPRLQEDG